MGFINQFPYSDFHELNIDWLIKQTKSSMDAIKTLEEQMAQINIMTKEEIESMINIAIETNNYDLYARMVSLKAEITNEYTSFVNSRISQLKIYLDNQDVYYDTLAQNYASNALHQAKDYTDEKVLDYTMMINPITGEYEDVRLVVDDIVSYFHTADSLTAAEYDALDLTAEDYDNYECSAYDYDFNGKNILV